MQSPKKNGRSSKLKDMSGCFSCCHDDDTQFEFGQIKCLLEKKQASEDNYNKIWTMNKIQCLTRNHQNATDY